MYGCESWTIKKTEHWGFDSFCTVLEKTLESPLDWKDINLKENQSWIFIGGTDAEAEVPILCHLMRRDDSGKDPDAGKDWRQKEKGTTEDEMVGRHHWLNGHEFEQAPGDGEGQGRLARCSPWGQKELDTTEQLSNNGSLSIIYTHSLLANILHWMYSCLAVYLENLENEPVNPYHIFGSLEFYTVEVDRWERKEYFSRRK